METFMISYDLGIPESSEDYKRIREYIKSLGDWAHPLQSVWFVKSDKGADEIVNGIKALTDSNDGILVLEITGDDWVVSRISKDVVDWMRANI